MKQLLIITLLCISYTGFSQNYAGNSGEPGHLALNTYISPDLDIPASSKNLLANKLMQVATKYGMAGSVLAPRFIITPNVVILTKDLTTTAPAMTVLTLDVTLYIGDGIEGKLFSSTNLSLKGVGNNESKAYSGAFKQINPSNPDIKALFEEGKAKIIQYYNSQCDVIINDAKLLAAKQGYDAAIYTLTAVPAECTECYQRCMEAAGPMYDKYVELDLDCKNRLVAAKAAWNAGQNTEAANNAGAILSTINSHGSCNNEVQLFLEEMKQKIQLNEGREWVYKLREQNQETDRIKALRDIGVAYGMNQQPTIIYKSLW